METILFTAAIAFGLLYSIIGALWYNAFATNYYIGTGESPEPMKNLIFIAFAIVWPYVALRILLVERHEAACEKAKESIRHEAAIRQNQTDRGGTKIQNRES